MHTRRELLAVCLLSFLPIILAQGYGQDPTGGENCRVMGCGTNAYCTNDYNNRVSVCRCKVGFEVSATNKSNCVDIYECSHREVCENGECMNTIGGFYCRCFNGYIPAADHTFCLLQDWAPQTDPWSDFWGFTDTSSTKHSEPTFDYNNPWGYSGPLSPNYVDSSYRPQSYYKDQGSKYASTQTGPLSSPRIDTFGGSQQNTIQRGRLSDSASGYFPHDRSFVDPMTKGNANIRGSGLLNKQDSWLTPRTSNSLMDPLAIDPAAPGSPGLDPWNIPAKSQGPAQSGHLMPFSNDPTLSTRQLGSGQAMNTLDTATSKHWTNDPWNQPTNAVDPLGHAQMVDISQTQHTEGIIPRDMSVDKSRVNANSITSGAAAVPQASSYPNDPNSISYQKNSQWLNFGQPSSNTAPAVRTTWQAAAPTSHKYSTHTGVSDTAQNQVSSRNTNEMPPPDNLSGHSLLLYFIMQNMYQ